MAEKIPHQLRITTPKGKSHLAPVRNLQALLHQNKVRKNHQRYQIEEVEVDKDGKVLNVVTVHFASDLLEAKAASTEKDNEIAKLKAELKAAEDAKAKAEEDAAAANKKIAEGAGKEEKPEDAKTLIEKINAAKTPEAVKELLGTDQRVSVVAAASKKIAELSK